MFSYSGFEPPFSLYSQRDEKRFAAPKHRIRREVVLLFFIGYIFFFTLLNMRVIVLVNALYLSFYISPPWLRNTDLKRKRSITPDLSDNVKKTKTFVSRLFGSTVFAVFYFKHCLMANCC